MPYNYERYQIQGKTSIAYFGGPSLVDWKALCRSVGVTKSKDIGASGKNPLSAGVEARY